MGEDYPDHEGECDPHGCPLTGLPWDLRPGWLRVCGLCLGQLLEGWGLRHRRCSFDDLPPRTWLAREGFPGPDHKSCGGPHRTRIHRTTPRRRLGELGLGNSTTSPRNPLRGGPGSRPGRNLSSGAGDTGLRRSHYTLTRLLVPDPWPCLPAIPSDHSTSLARPFARGIAGCQARRSLALVMSEQ